MAPGLVPPVPAAPPVDDLALAGYVQESLRWAMDVYWVFENHSGRVTKAVAGTSSRWGLYQYAKKNMDQFMGQLVPKAMVMIEKARAKMGDPDEIVVEEKKGIADLKRILIDAVKESRGEE